MKPRIIVIWISVVVIFTIQARGQSIGLNHKLSFTYRGNVYEIIKENKTWSDAAMYAVERGGYLAQINSEKEQDTINYYLTLLAIDVKQTVAPDGGGASYVWIGGNDMAKEGIWIWDGNNDGNGIRFWKGKVNGHAVNGCYTNWGHEPDNYQNQDGLALALTNWPLGVAGQWNDVDTANKLYFLVEIETGGRKNSSEN